MRHLRRPTLARLGDRAARERVDGETGSLILDILIGMAIFALIAIIAISAIGQYRMRAYIQTAVSDAQQTASALSAYITDQATTTSEDYPAGYPTGELDEAALAALQVTPSGLGSEPSVIVVYEGQVRSEDFYICVEHKGGFAEYDMSAGGLVNSGDMSKEGFEGCGGGTTPIAAPYCAYSEGSQPALIPRYDEAAHSGIPQLAGSGLADGDAFLPWDYFEQDDWKYLAYHVAVDPDTGDDADLDGAIALYNSFFPFTAATPIGYDDITTMGYTGWNWSYGFDDVVIGEDGVSVDSNGVLRRDGELFVGDGMRCE